MLPSFLLLALLAPPLPVIFDTDMGNDVDDALALAMLHALESRGEIELLAVTVTKDNPWAPRYVSAVNTFYKRPGIPIGVTKSGVTPDDGYNRKALELGRHAYSDKTEDAVSLLRRTLEAQPDGAVTVIQVGFSTNLARLLGSPGGRELVRRKVKLLSLMAGDFEKPNAEYNVKMDIPAALALVKEWPTPMVWSGFEVGRTIKFPARSILRDFAWAPKHPVVDAYKVYMKMPYDRETWDLTSVLYAVRPDDGYFSLSEAGDVQIDGKGVTAFAARPGGRSRYLKVDEVQRRRALEAMIWLASEPVR
ncbi:MAG: nucleoside hydrolase [Bryobacteraceae bacterium]|nr:nucleoside hydrolase [Bryobacteraceae bacterium]